jgi:hypothetical protein
MVIIFYTAKTGHFYAGKYMFTEAKKLHTQIF